MYHVNSLVYYDTATDFVKYLMFGLSIFLFGLGLLLPDIDTNSTISNFLHFKIPGPHRGLTHSLWLVMLFMAFGFVYVYPLRFLALGILNHDIVDSFSAAGWVPFYPFGSYKISNDIVCAKNRHITLYSSKAKYSEAVCLLVFVLISVILLGFEYFMLFHFI